MKNEILVDSFEDAVNKLSDKTIYTVYADIDGKVVMNKVDVTGVVHSDFADMRIWALVQDAPEESYYDAFIWKTGHLMSSENAYFFFDEKDALDCAVQLAMDRVTQATKHLSEWIQCAREGHENREGEI